MFVDTPGVHKPTHRMNVRMVDIALEAMREVDVVCLVVDASVKPGPGDRHLLTLLKDVKTPAILALNKVDLVSKPKLLPLLDQYSEAHPFVELVPLSAVRWHERRYARAAVSCSYLPEGEPLYPPDYLTDQPERFFVVGDRARAGAAADARRAAVLDGRGRRQVRRSRGRRTDQALLHDPGRTRVAEADRGRERRRDDQGDRHRRAPGAGASTSDSSVFLDLHVKVKSEWRDDERVLDEIGAPFAADALPDGLKVRLHMIARGDLKVASTSTSVDLRCYIEPFVGDEISPWRRSAESISSSTQSSDCCALVRPPTC